MASDKIKDGVKNSKSFQPGDKIKPRMNESTAEELVRRLYRFERFSLTELPGYDDRNYCVIVTPDDSIGNHGNHRDGYILKVLNSRDSQGRHVDGEHEMMRVLKEHNIRCPQPVKNVFGEDLSIQLIDDAMPNDPNATELKSPKHIVRLLTFVPGDLMVSKPYTPTLLYRFGKFVSSINRALQNFRHPELENLSFIWKMGNTTDLRLFTFAIEDERQRKLVNDVIDAFEVQVVPNEPNLSEGVIHGDLNEKNVLVQSAANGETELVGVIDFGDSSWSPYVYEVAIAIVYAMLESHEIDPFDVGAHILAGYLDDGEQVPLLKKADLSILRTCVAARLATSLTMGAYAYSLDLTNGEYLLGTAKRGWAMLERLWIETTEAELYDIWDAVMRNSYGKSFY